MGDRLQLLADRQYPDLTATKPIAEAGDDTGAADPAIRFVVLTLLAVDGILSAVAGALLLPAYIGSIPFPISALISGLANAALVWAAMHWTASTRVAALPLWTWLLTVAGMTLGGPGDDIIFDYHQVGIIRAVLLIVLGIASPLWVLWRHGRPTGPVDAAPPK